MMIVEAAASLVPDLGWLEDLGENMCHGSPVSAVGRLTLSGLAGGRQAVPGSLSGWLLDFARLAL